MKETIENTLGKEINVGDQNFLLLCEILFVFFYLSSLPVVHLSGDASRRRLVVVCLRGGRGGNCAKLFQSWNIEMSYFDRRPAPNLGECKDTGRN